MFGSAFAPSKLDSGSLLAIENSVSGLMFDQRSIDRGDTVPASGLEANVQ